MMLIDNFRLDMERKFPCWFMLISPTRASPGRQGFVETLYRTQGIDPRPDTAVLRRGGRRVHVSGSGSLVEPVWEGSPLVFGLWYFAGDTAYALLAGLDEPEEIRVNGAVLPRVLDLDQAAQGWLRYRRMLLVKVSNGDGASVTVHGAVPEVPLELFAGGTAASAEWNAGELKGWFGGSPPAAPVTVAVTDDGLRFDGESETVRLVSPPVERAADALATGTVTLGTPAPEGEGRLFWCRADAPRFHAERSVPLTFRTQGRGGSAGFRLDTHPEWRGTITRLRVDLPLAGGLSVKTVRLSRNADRFGDARGGDESGQSEQFP